MPEILKPENLVSVLESRLRHDVNCQADLTGSTAAAGESCVVSIPVKKESKCSLKGVSNGGRAGCTAAAPPSLPPLLATHSLTPTPASHFIALTVVSAAGGDQTEQPTG